MNSREQLSETLRSVVDGVKLPGLSVNQTLSAETRRLVFVYTGMGPQWWGMGRELFATQSVFRARVEECDAIFSRYAGWSVLEALSASEDASRMAETQVAQPANFVLQVALTALWKSWGITPDAVVGHSIGEVAAAYVSGALSLDDALLVCYHRSRLQQTRAGLGSMLAVGLPEEAVLELIRPFAGRVDVAAVNSSSSVTLAGESASLEHIAAKLATHDVFHRFLRVEVAYHSFQMEPICEALLTALASIRPANSTIPFWSTVSGAQMDTRGLTADYWWQNVRQPVRFGQAMRTLLEEQYHTFLEVGPHPVLHNSIQEALRASNRTGEILSSLHREKPERATILNALGALYTLGYSPDWPALVSSDAQHVKLPTYPWQREYYWHETAASKLDRLGQPGSVFLNTPLKLPVPAWEVELNTTFFPYLNDHCLDNAVIFPGAGYVEAGLAIHGALHPQETYTLEHLEFQKMLVIDPKDTTIMHVRCDANTHEYKVYSRRKGDEAPWELHAAGRLLPGASRPRPHLHVSDLQTHCCDEITANAFYDRLKVSKFYYGPYFQGLERIWIGDNQALGRISAHPALASDSTPYTVHPTLLDASFQLLTLNAVLRASRPWVPRSIDRIVVHASPASSCWAHTEVVERGQGTLRGNIVLCDDDGNVTVEITGILCQELITSAIQEGWQQSLYEWAWEPLSEDITPSTPVQTSPWLILSDSGELTQTIQALLETHRVRHMLATSADDMERVLTDRRSSFGTILYLCSGPDPAEASTHDFEAATGQCTTLLNLLHALPAERIDAGL
ncbi:MAG: acyltransferase domain-containing protein, partial [Acidobacteriaceae bacterium]|nr:acyltransferase domain-containing protein [Acidobacteriaceae bacterium]